MGTPISYKSVLSLKEQLPCISRRNIYMEQSSETSRNTDAPTFLLNWPIYRVQEKGGNAFFSQNPAGLQERKMREWAKLIYFLSLFKECMFLRKMKRPGNGEDGEAIASSVLITVGCHLLNLIMATVG